MGETCLLLVENESTNKKTFNIYPKIKIFFV